MSQWLGRANFSPWGYVGLQTYLANERGASNAVRHIGTNAIPSLLRMLERKDSRIALPLSEWAFKHKLNGLVYDRAEGFSYGFIHYKFAGFVQRNAEIGFRFLGGDASNATPSLIQIYRENISEDSRIDVLESLRCIGSSAKEASPMLMDVITNADANASHLVRCVAVHTLAHCGRAEPQNVWPFLTSVLTNGSPAGFKRPFTTAERLKIRVAAAEALGDYGPKATPTVPAFVAILDEIKQSAEPEPFKSIDWEVVNDALMKIDPETARKMLGVKNAEKK